MNNKEHLRLQVKNIPEKPGIYLFRGRGGEIIYVGKALNLRKRVRTYFNKKNKYGKVNAMVREIASLDYYVTANEVEALIMENNFIKEHKPVFNVAYKDDKSYPYLAVSTRQPFPRLRYTRERRRRGVRYFGPYPNANALRETLDLLISIFPLRSCGDSLFKQAAAVGNPCLYYHIKRCSAPCVGKISRRDYQQLVAAVIAFLNGRQEPVVEDLRRRMQQAAADLEFEQAAYYRDRLAAAEKILVKQKVTSDSRLNQDIFGLASTADFALVQLLKVRGGKLVGTEDFILDRGGGSSPDELLAGLIKQYYAGDRLVPVEVLLSRPLEEQDTIAAWLSRLSGRRVKVFCPQRGFKRRLTAMAMENAGHSLRRRQLRREWEKAGLEQALKDLESSLNLSKIDIIECYDISMLAGREAVGSMVVFQAGRPRRQAYRRFKIRSLETPNDYAMIKEVLSRRLARLSPERRSGFAQKPDLIIVDGGKPQLKAALDALAELEIADVPVAALAKKEEELYLPGRPRPLRLPRDSAGLYLLQRLRNEAHRFAHDYHQRLRRKTVKASVLDLVPGIGRRRKAALLRRFGSVEGIRQAGPAAVEAVVGKVLAAKVMAAVRDKPAV